MQTSLTFVKVDVSGLAPPEPMSAILNHLSILTVQECLLIKHRREPFPLYEKLESNDFSFHRIVHSSDDITLYIFHQSAQGKFDHWLKGNSLAEAGLNKGKSSEH